MTVLELIRALTHAGQIEAAAAAIDSIYDAELKKDAEAFLAVAQMTVREFIAKMGEEVIQDSRQQQLFGDILEAMYTEAGYSIDDKMSYIPDNVTKEQHAVIKYMERLAPKIGAAIRKSGHQ
jgi:hypothetical protein